MNQAIYLMLKDKFLKLLFFCLCPFSLLAESYPEVIFDNSILSGNYAKSAVRYTGKSWVENVHGKLPVSDSLFFTPGNSLSLKYRSAAGAQWTADIYNNKQVFTYKLASKSVLTLRLYVHSGASKATQLPHIVVKQGDVSSEPLELGNYIDRFAKHAWLTVKIPVNTLKNLQEGQPISGVQLLQGEAASMLHELYIDQIEFLPASPSSVELSSAAVLTKVESVAKQVTLSWQLPLTPSIRYIKIYRGETKDKFEPIGIFPIYMQKGFDHVPQLDKTYFYKITWVDYKYKESLYSDVKMVTPKAADTEQLLSFIQAAHVNYFVDHYDINSGMFMSSKVLEQPVVSVKETGFALMSLLVGAENNFISRKQVLNRATRVVNFLTNTPHKEGIFPAFFDGRKGVPYTFSKDISYDVRATATLMESLLLCRQYFFKEDAEEEALRKKITFLWHRINWGAFTKDQHNMLLLDSWTADTEFSNSNILYGVNESLNTYLLAMASPTFPLADSAYIKGYGMNHLHANTQPAQRTIFEEYDYEFLDHSYSATAEANLKPLAVDTMLYGENIHFPLHQESLLDLYRLCMTFNPKGKKDHLFDYEKETLALQKVWQRRDNEYFPEGHYTTIWGLQATKSTLERTRLNPALSIASMAFDKKEGALAWQAIYQHYGEKLFSENGFRAWLDVRNHDIAGSYSPQNQALIAVMIENAKTGLLWNLMAEDPDMQKIWKKIYTPL